MGNVRIWMNSVLLAHAFLVLCPLELDESLSWPSAVADSDQLHWLISQLPKEDNNFVFLRLIMWSHKHMPHL
jgi:hypothetical protein